MAANTKDSKQNAFKPLITLLILALSSPQHANAFSIPPGSFPSRATIPLSIALASPASATSRSRAHTNYCLPALRRIILRSKHNKEEEIAKIDGKHLLESRNDDDNPNKDAPNRKSILQKITHKFKSNTPVPTMRGNDKYGATNNSTILTPSDAAIKVGVRPTLEATKETWQRAWKLHRFMMKWLHYWDGCQPKDSKLALACLWWKAIAGNDPSSPVYDYQLSYDLLPPITRWVVHRRLCRFYPRLHHANVEIRTAYLDKSVANVIAAICANSTSDNTSISTESTSESITALAAYPSSKSTNTNTTFNPIPSTISSPRKKIRLIVMGGGYDTRSFKLLEQSLLTDDQIPHHKLLQKKQTCFRQLFRRRQPQPQLQNAFAKLPSSIYDMECYELDLPEVVSAKSKLLNRRLSRRRPWLGETSKYPQLIPVNFNNLNETRRALEKIIDGPDTCKSNVENLILFEGVMIYLDQGIPHSLLELCSDVLRRSHVKGEGYLCFADRLENIPGGDKDLALIEMDRTGWELMDWLSKPGLARHMGVARLKKNT